MWKEAGVLGLRQRIYLNGLSKKINNLRTTGLQAEIQVRETSNPSDKQSPIIKSQSVNRSFPMFSTVM
jgi:hypothetical protein